MLPKAFLDKQQLWLGEQFDEYLAAMQKSATRGLHLNLCKGIAPLSCDDIAKELGRPLQPLSYASDGFLLQDGCEISVGKLPLHHAGAYYMQEPSAMAPVCCLPLREGMKVLDLCASPGGKSSQIANRIGETGLLVANEINPQRCATLAGNIERMGIRNAIVTNTDAKTLAFHLHHYFDVVVVDAPCSGEGMFRKTPEAIAEWQESTPALCATRQKEILSYAIHMLKPNGFLLYSTCTFSHEENEDVLSWLLTEYPAFTLCPVPVAVQNVTLPGLHSEAHDLSLARRFSPHYASGEGQFMALLQKNNALDELPLFSFGPSPHKQKKAPSSFVGKTQDADKKVAISFVAEVLTEKGRVCCPTPMPFKDGFTLPPNACLDTFPLPHKEIYAYGVKLGEVRKGRVVPFHHFFTAYGHHFKQIVSFSSQNPLVLSYLRGESVPCDTPNGWGVLAVDGYAIGGVKITDGMAKNHYPSGLRNHA